MRLSVVGSAPRMDGHDVESRVDEGVAGIPFATNSFFDDVLLHQLFRVWNVEEVKNPFKCFAQQKLMVGRSDT